MSVVTVLCLSSSSWCVTHFQGGQSSSHRLCLWTHAVLASAEWDLALSLLKYPVAFWPHGLEGSICASKISIHSSTLMLLSHIHMQVTHFVGAGSPPIPPQMQAPRLLLITDGLHCFFSKASWNVDSLLATHFHYLSVHMTCAWIQRTQCFCTELVRPAPFVIEFQVHFWTVLRDSFLNNCVNKCFLPFAFTHWDFTDFF